MGPTLYNAEQPGETDNGFGPATRKRKTCQWCQGAGRQLLQQSWFIEDGYRRERCGICGGSGESNFAADSKHLAFQREATARVQEWGGLKPGLVSGYLTRSHITLPQALAASDRLHSEAMTAVRQVFPHGRRAVR